MSATMPRVRSSSRLPRKESALSAITRPANAPILEECDIVTVAEG